jgi:hypothetical protein
VSTSAWRGEIFAAVKEKPVRPWGKSEEPSHRTDEKQLHPGVRKLGFADFCSRTYAAANRAAFTAANLPAKNQSVPSFRQPSADEYFRALETEWQEIDCDEGLNAHQAAFRQDRGELFGGVICEPVLNVLGGVVCSALRWQKGRWVKYTGFIEEAVWSDAIDSAQVGSTARPPPYVAIGVLDGNGDFRRLWMRLAYCCGRDAPIAVDSAFERCEAHRLRSTGAIVFKPQHRDDMCELLSALGASDAASSDHRLEPDFIFWEIHNPRIPIVCELAGYDGPDHAAYHQRLQAKEAYYLQPGHPWQYRRVRGANSFQPTSTSGPTVLIDAVVLTLRSRLLLLTAMVGTFSP